MSENEKINTEEHDNFFVRLKHFFWGEPANQEELREILQDASKRDVLTQDALQMMEGALEVTEKQVRDIMIPRGKMIVLEHDWSLSEILHKVTDFRFFTLPCD